MIFSEEQENNIVNAIKIAEKNTSGEIKIHIEEGENLNSLERAKEVFSILGMEKTNLRNGVIIYVDKKNRLFAIYGDEGINNRVSQNFWDDIKEVIANNFKNNKFEEGLVDGIKMIGRALKIYFPYLNDDVNELSDEISKGNI